ncbi:MAG: L,D-transpeptidase [Candidatus Sumerlaeia bacterium]|nr:L,D-transpeptidase [Candidatus Sumerlaeia bacterium]
MISRRRQWLLTAAVIPTIFAFFPQPVMGQSARYGEADPSVYAPQPERRGLFGSLRRFRGGVQDPDAGPRQWQAPRQATPQPVPESYYRDDVIEDPNNPVPSTVPRYRLETIVTPDERPRSSGAFTVAAPAAQQGSVGQVGRQINFPRDPNDDLDVLKLQIFLDYHGYSPGEIDGQWGYNTGRALYVYQMNNGLQPTGQLDERIMARLNSFDRGYLLDYTVTEEDVKGPFYEIPRDYYAMAKLKYLPYESLSEKMGEKFHCSPVLLRKLNPGVDLDNLQPGQRILGLNVLRGIDESRGKVSVVRISKHNKWTEAFDSEGRFMFYYPSTLGSKHDPLPLGTYQVTAVNHKPTFMYQPKLFWDVDDSKPPALLPPGPNSPVGIVWIGTSRKSVGIHGTPNPEAISKTTSHGCIRLTNWDALQLASRVSPGTRLEFVE